MLYSRVLRCSGLDTMYTFRQSLNASARHLLLDLCQQINVAVLITSFGLRKVLLWHMEGFPDPKNTGFLTFFHRTRKRTPFAYCVMFILCIMIASGNDPYPELTLLILFGNGAVRRHACGSRVYPAGVIVCVCVVTFGISSRPVTRGT